MNSNAVLNDVSLVGLSSRQYKDKIYHNAIIILNNYPVQVNVTERFYNDVYKDFSSKKVLFFDMLSINLSSYKGEFRVTLV